MQAGAEITSVSVSSDGRNLLSRSRDDTLKVWDMRNLKEALASFGDLDNVYDTTAAVFGPNDTLFMTGTSVRKAKDGTSLGNGQLHVYDRATLKPVRQLGFPSGSVVSLLWHPKINQMFVGGQAGSVHAMYDPRQSEGGIMRSVGKASKKADITSVGINSVSPSSCVLFHSVSPQRCVLFHSVSPLSCVLLHSISPLSLPVLPSLPACFRLPAPFTAPSSCLFLLLPSFHPCFLHFSLRSPMSLPSLVV